MQVTIYHNPRCSKSRQALELLKKRGIEPEIVEYLKTSPDPKTLERLLKLLHIKPREILRKNEPEYKQAGLDDPTLNDEDLISAIIQHPILLERPIVVSGAKAVIGRPPERVFEIL
ncbi:MAG: arsenate reductase (glutaredoxin) [Gammaproteobacteria bacterium]